MSNPISQYSSNSPNLTSVNEISPEVQVKKATKPSLSRTVKKIKMIQNWNTRNDNNLKTADNSKDHQC